MPGVSVYVLEPLRKGVAARFRAFVSAVAAVFGGGATADVCAALALKPAFEFVDPSAAPASLEVPGPLEAEPQ